MNPKKIFGYLFIIVAVILTLAIIVLLPQFMKALLPAVFNNHSGSYEIAYNVGYITYWIIHPIITIILWRVGIRWIKR
ncbi:hypothetical protein SAMN02927937_01892 [Paenimyroides aquimaris]|uniref:Uncharacterized protein n=1 Tax=Paenimyroides marinum TaxID=1159016 RepID=A0A1H6LRR8_9FLAO|nr:hypothetical protein SAMN02927937_01892 [Paenimyroides aquimaris]